jgi:NAD-dependent SIR2 family protein deacetylase
MSSSTTTTSTTVLPSDNSEDSISQVEMQSRLVAAAAAIREANAVLILSGAGLGVDSGLPDFRGKTGFWRAYPPMQKLGLEFAQMSTPHWFKTRPALAWGFFGHRYQLYKMHRFTMVI